jgi:nitrate/nitrite transport system substrate-binding protein
MAVTATTTPERDTITVGFMPLTDCAALVMAAEGGFDRRHGIRIVLQRETSWANVRDKLGAGMLDAAHMLHGMAVGVELGVGCRQVDMAILMAMSQNGQSITLSKALAGEGATDGASLAALVHQQRRRYAFAQTFPTGNHAMLLYYWLAAHGVDPFAQARVFTVPPPQMVNSLRAGIMDGFCAGEPWGARAVAEGVGVTVATSQQIWRDHPGKVLATTAAYADSHPNTGAALVAAVLEASRWLDESDDNRLTAAAVLAGPRYLNMDVALIAPRMLGQYDNGLGTHWQDQARLRFYADGAATFPYLSDSMWFMTQQKRWGMLKQDPDYLGVATRLNRLALYRAAAELTGTALPAAPLRSAALVDGVLWDGEHPSAYAASFAIRRD